MNDFANERSDVFWALRRIDCIGTKRPFNAFFACTPLLSTKTGIQTHAAKNMVLTHTQGLERRAPIPRRNWALFLDVDGTLIDIASSPSAVIVPETLVQTLAKASDWLGGALAFASGRPIEQIDRLFAPLRLSGAGEHGASLRLPDGSIQNADHKLAVPIAWKIQLFRTTKSWAGVLVEDKPFGVTIHFRQAPLREWDVRELVDRVIGDRSEEYTILPARMALEIRSRRFNKAMVVDQFLQYPPFRGRIPIFVGDDRTDEDGFCAARKHGGLGLRVQDVFQGRPANVRNWLDTFRSATAFGEYR